MEALKVVDYICGSADIQNDKWGRESLHWLASLTGLVKAEGQYHHTCLMSIMSNFEEIITVYSKEHHQRKFEENFGNHLTIAKIARKNRIFFFTHHMKDILSEECHAGRKVILLMRFNG